jgi:hypothetical protein
MLARDKHSSLLRKSVNYGQKRFITLAPEFVEFLSLSNQGILKGEVSLYCLTSCLTGLELAV